MFKIIKSEYLSLIEKENVGLEFSITSFFERVKAVLLKDWNDQIIEKSSQFKVQKQEYEY